MIPYTGLLYFLVVIALSLPMLAFGGRLHWAGRIWTGLCVVIMLWVQYNTALHMAPTTWIPEIVPLVIFGVFELALVHLALRCKPLRRSAIMIPLGLLPLVIAKYMPAVLPDYQFGFAGISYVTFRALDVLWSITDGVLVEAGTVDLLMFLFFFPTISSGPIDRFRRFRTDWRRVRTRTQVVADFSAGIDWLFRGLLYKYVIATLIDLHLVKHAEMGTNLHGAVYYAYAYSAYLFFDFAGYSAFAVGVSRWFGVHSPENFNRPWSAPNIREFWNRWHISLSVWFRDHVYMRFVLMASKRKWFKKRETTSSVGYFVSFGLMGLWHGLAPHFLIYGVYHACLLAGYDMWARWRKRNPERFTDTRWRWVAHFLTIHAVVIGLWLFSGHGWLTREPEIPASEPSSQMKLDQLDP